MSSSLPPHGLQYARHFCPPLSLKLCSNSCPLNQWCYLTISSCAPLFFCLQSCPVSGSFPMSRLFTTGGQSIEASASVLPVNIQSWFPLGLTGLISLQSKEPSRVFSSPQFKSINSSVLSLLYGQLSYLYMTTGKTTALIIKNFVCKVMSLLFSVLSRFV